MNMIDTHFGVCVCVFMLAATRPIERECSCQSQALAGSALHWPQHWSPGALCCRRGSTTRTLALDTCPRREHCGAATVGGAVLGVSATRPHRAPSQMGARGAWAAPAKARRAELQEYAHVNSGARRQVGSRCAGACHATWACPRCSSPRPATPRPAASRGTASHKCASLSSVVGLWSSCVARLKGCRRGREMLVGILPAAPRGGVIRLLPFRGLYDDAADIPAFDVFDLTPSTCECQSTPRARLHRGPVAAGAGLARARGWGTCDPAVVCRSHLGRRAARLVRRRRRAHADDAGAVSTVARQPRRLPRLPGKPTACCQQ